MQGRLGSIAWQQAASLFGKGHMPSSPSCVWPPTMRMVASGIVQTEGYCSSTSFRAYQISDVWSSLTEQHPQSACQRCDNTIHDKQEQGLGLTQRAPELGSTAGEK